MGIIHQKGNAPLPAHAGKAGYVADAAKIIRAGQVNGEGIAICLQGLLNRFRGDPPLFRPDPDRFYIKQCRRVDRGTVRSAAHDYLAAPRRAKAKHGLDAQSASAGGNQGALGAKQGGGKFFGL